MGRRCQGWGGEGGKCGHPGGVPLPCEPVDELMERDEHALIPIGSIRRFIQY